MRLAVLALSVLALALSGCESSQDKSTRLAKFAKAGRHETGIVVKARNPAVQVLRTAVVHDQYGVAAAVELRMRGRKAQAGMPLLLRVAGPDGKAAYSNGGAGLAPSLNHVPLLRPGERVWWVDDQVIAGATGRASAKVGAPTAPVAASAPRLAVGSLKLESDSSGAFTRGTLRNPSAVEQRNVTVFAVAERGGRVVAAGRAGIERVKAKAQEQFKVFWIGNPAGARVSVFAPPSVLKEAK